MSGLQVFVYEPRITPVPVSGLNPGCSPGLRGASCGRRGGGGGGDIPGATHVQPVTAHTLPCACVYVCACVRVERNDRAPAHGD